jgi:cytochrome c5
VTRVSRRTFALVVAAAAIAAAGAGRAQDAAQSATESTPYTVECGPDADEAGATTCRVDRGTYVGWRTFHGICHTCHAQDAVGSTFAPDLLVRMRQIGKPEFMKALTDGFQGQVGVMPPWSQDPNVSKYFEELWSYLKARSDGVLLPGRPKRLPAEP